MTPDLRTQALLDLVEQDRRAQCEALIGQAMQQAESARAQARAEARGQVRAAFAERRTRARERITAARAQLQTRRRLHEQQQAAAWLALAWQQLPQALQRRWHDDDTRRLWLDAAVSHARRALPAGSWRIAFAPGWPAGERDEMATRLHAEAGVDAVFDEDAALQAGLRLCAGGTVVDATLAGLTADRREIGAELLAAWAEQE